MSNNPGEILFQSSTGTQIARIYTGTNDLVLTTQSNNFANIHINAAGQVGIGTDLQRSELTVDGHITPVSNNTFSLGTISYRWNTVYATNGTINTSDRRLKTNIRDLEYGLGEVLALKAKTFNWKESPNEQQKLGFMAQDLLELMPEVVNVGDDSLKTLGVHYSDLIPVLTKAIQQQQAIIDGQQSEINQLKAEREEEAQKQEETESRLDAIEKLLLTGEVIKE